MRVALLGCLFVLFLFSFAYADIYKYIDENGIVCYTDRPFGKKADKVIEEKKTLIPNQEQAVLKNPKDTSDYHSIVHNKAAKYDIDPSLIKAVIKTESNWNHKAVSRKGAMGLMQLMPVTASDMDVHNPFNPEENIEGGVKYLKYLLERFNGDLTLALAAYNAGPTTVEKFGFSVPPITETKQYVSKVLSLYNGKLTYSQAGGDTSKKEEKPEEEKPEEKKPDPIYKVVFEDGTALFTNSTLLLKNAVRF
ncbi:MAG: lytic transglycosylase domain-containing protein [Nitrospira sp.]|nr:lytic transglycosylase domain-containing protein [Nitrospira sp.]